MRTEIQRDRTKKIRADFKLVGFDGLVVTQRANVRYATGFTGDESWVIITARKVYLLTDSRYTEQAKRECDCDVLERKGAMCPLAAKILNRQSSIGVVGMESSTSIGTFKTLTKALNAKLKPADRIINKVRQIKDQAEVRNIIKAGKIAMEALKRTLKSAKSGVTENELAGLLDFNIRKLGSTIGFDTIVAFGAGASQPHYVPGNKKLKADDTILVDFGATYNGYTCDITRCVVIGKARRKYQAAYRAVLEAQAAAIAKVGPGVSVAEIDYAAREVIKKAGLPQYGHGTGHGLGLEVHELPMVSGKLKDVKLQPGNVITIEPGVYIPGKLGIRIEDDVLVTKTGCKVLMPSDLK